ncbi:MAG: NHLP bacteriocin export ABC transporter permease/ATPase subunit [Chloroflexi bacterium]|nr:NHLP bacteriocin export ABC transporter permease/ATPase subunit [Chloroflexota bacterium]
MANAGVITTNIPQKDAFELFLLKLRYREGRLLDVEGNHPLLLDDPASAWIVYAGTVDVFAVPVENKAAIGARNHVFRGVAGQLLMGMDLSQRDQGMGLLVTGTPETQVLRIRRSRLQELATDLEYHDLIAAMLEAWAEGLLASIPADVLPKDYTLLEPDKEATVEEPRVAVPKRNLLWARPLEGNALLMDHPELSWQDTAHFLPVSRQTWLRPAGQLRLQTASTNTLLSQDPAWASLDALHALILTNVQNRREQSTLAEQQRLEKKAGAEHAVMDRALANLSSPLTNDAGAELAGILRDDEHPAVAACRLVGDKLGISIRTYPGIQRERSSKTVVANIAKASRFRVREVALRGEWWRTDSGPLLGFMENTGAGERPVALLPVSPRQYELVDPVERTRTPITAAVDARLAPFAYTFYRPFPDRAMDCWDLIRFGFWDCKKDWFSMFVAGAAVGLLGLVPPAATKLLFNDVIPNAEQNRLWQVGLGLVLIALVTGVFQFTRSLAVLRLQSKLDAYGQAAIWDRILSLPTPFFRDYTSGDLGVRAMGITEVRRILSGHVLSTLLTGVFAWFNLILLFRISARLAWLALGLAALIAVATAIVGSLQVRYQRQLYRLQGQVSGKVLQLLTGIAKFRAAGAERRAFAIWADGFTAERKLSLKARAAANGLLTLNGAYPVLTSLVIFAAASSLSPADLPTGDFTAFNLAFTQFITAMLSMGAILVSVLMVVPLFERTKPILQAVPEVNDYKVDPGELSGDLEVSHLSFRYKPDGPQILKDISLRIRPGEFVALVGPSGSGKSTLLRLLLGFEQPESGGVFYDGQDLAGLDLRAVRQQIGVVLQSAKIMAGEIYTNIVGSSPYLTLDDAWEAARRAGLDEDIRAMPMGMNTVISEEGSNLSGGQRQRLLIARAIVHKPRILFFDEATSALDNQTQEIVSRSLEELQATRVVIAHRLTTVANADRIYVIEAGRIVQSGSYDELLNQPGPFAELAKRQMA